MLNLKKLSLRFLFLCCLVGCIFFVQNNNAAASNDPTWQCEANHQGCTFNCYSPECYQGCWNTYMRCLAEIPINP
jgi:hypothetical protein